MAEATTDTTTGESDTSDEHDGFNVVSEMPLGEWLDFGFGHHGEYIHVIPDFEARKLRLYRSISEPGEDNKLIKTTIPNVSIGLDLKRNDDLRNWYVTGYEAETLMTVLDTQELRGGAYEPRVKITYYEDNGKGLFDGKALTEESLYFEIRAENGIEREACINSVWENDVQMLARFEEGMH